MTNTTPGRTGGWSNRSAYPLMVSQIVDHALVKMQADRNLSRGKALNVALAEGLITLGYLERPKTPEELRKQASDMEIDFIRRNWKDMPLKSRAYWLDRYPDLVKSLD